MFNTSPAHAETVRINTNFTYSIPKNQSSQVGLLFITLAFHTEVYLLGLEVFKNMLIQVPCPAKNSLFFQCIFPNLKQITEEF